MNPGFNPNHPLDEAALELLIASQTDALSPDDSRRLESALRRADPAEIEHTLRAVDAARLALRGAEPGQDDLPPALEARLKSQAVGYFAGLQTAEPRLAISTQSAQPPRSAATPARWTRSAGWLAAAAALLLALIVWSARPPAPGPSIAKVDARADTKRWNFEAKTDTMKTVTGEVVWNDELQQGYMVLANLPANDPAKSQYQLWIVDPSRAEQPVDGGVFNAPRPGERIAFAPRLPVDKPAAFAITEEKPGGVVVSKGPLLTVAARK